MRSHPGRASTAGHTPLPVGARSAANGVADPVLGSPEPSQRPGSGSVVVVLGEQEVRGADVGGAVRERLRQRGAQYFLATRSAEPDGAVSPSGTVTDAFL